jgi:glutamate racemase
MSLQKSDKPALITAAASGPIGIFDSGVGGLSVAKAVHKLMPQEDLLYVADTAFSPYGDKSPELILQRMRTISVFLIAHNAKAIVIACNTATTAAVRQLRQEFSLPIIGVEPGIKPAVALSQSGVIAVLATPRTLQNSAFTELAERVKGHAKVLLQPCPALVSFIEALDFKSAMFEQVLCSYLTPLISQGADTLVLGCTHYNFIAPQIARLAEQMAGRAITIVRTEDAVAGQLQRRLQQLGQLSAALQPPTLQFYSSGDTCLFQRQLQCLWGPDAKAKALL